MNWPGPQSEGCHEGWIGDNWCDDVNNNMDCSYDGGDCCGCNVNTDYCEICGCSDPNASGSSTTATVVPNTGTTATGLTANIKYFFCWHVKQKSPYVSKLLRNNC